MSLTGGTVGRVVAGARVEVSKELRIQRLWSLTFPSEGLRSFVLGQLCQHCLIKVSADLGPFSSCKIEYNVMYFLIACLT